MKQSKKGNQWYFGRKPHVAVDAKTQLIHRVVATSGNVHDGKVLPQLLHGKELAVWGDAAYSGQGPVIREHAPWAQDFHAAPRACLQVPQPDAAPGQSKALTRSGASRACHRCHQRVFGFAKVCYRGLAKNGNRLFVAAALANLHTLRKPLLDAAQG